MPSSWLLKRTTDHGATRYQVRYRLGGAESKQRYGGSFKTKTEALARKRWIDGELANMRSPDLGMLEVEPVRSPTLADASRRWRDSRVDVTEGTQSLHRIALDRVLPTLGEHRIDAITVDDINGLVAHLSKTGRKRETIRKSVKYLAAVLEENGVMPNPARDKRIRLPFEEAEEIVPPIAEHVETVARLLARPYRIPLAWLDWSGARVASIDATLVGDYDEQARRVRLRAATTKTRKALWVDLPEVLADAIEASLPPREDRDLDAQLFAGASSDRLRTAIGRACKAAGVPVFSPHDLRHRRISLLHKQGLSWAEIGAFVGQRKLSLTSDVYTHVLSDGREVDYGGVLVHPPVHAYGAHAGHV